MRIRKEPYIILLALSLCAHAESRPQWSLEYQFSGDLKHPPEAEARLNQWYRDARYGALVCLGPYSIAAGEYKGQVPTKAYAEWIQISAKIPAEEYRRELAEKFNPKELDADEWARTFKEVGLKYVVLTAKFHDGFALYDSKVSDFDVMDASPFKRDVIKEVSEACYRHGLKFGIYYSQAYDWEQPNAPFPPGRGPVQQIHPDLPDDFKFDMDSYLEAKAYPQIEELVKNYAIDLIWFDTPVCMNEERAKRFVNIVRKYRPDCVISSRLLLGNRTKILQEHLGIVDYISLPDKKISDHKLPLTFECPDSVSSSYGYKAHGSHVYHTEKELMERFVHTVCAGGNYLLNCGIMPNGKIDPKAVELYGVIGKWLKHSGESLTGISGSPFPEKPEWGDISASKSGDVLYLHVLKWPADNAISLKGISGKVDKLSFLSSADLKPEFKQTRQSLNIKLPPEPLDDLNTVIKVELKDDKKKLPPGPPTIVGELDGQVLVSAGGAVLLDKDGKELWSYKSRGCHDLWKLDNGNVLLADNTVKEINPKTDEIVFNYEPEVTKGGGTYACQRLANGNTLAGENSTGRILELDKDGKIVFELKVEPYKEGNHHNLRMVRKLDNGNYLVCHSGAKLVREYTPKGEIVFEVTVSQLAFSAVRLENGNTLVGDISRVVEYDPQGREVWVLNASELKGLNIGKICGINVLPNGNMLLGIYAARQVENGGSLLEVTHDKKVVWRYYRVNGERSMMSAQKLDSSGKAVSNLR